MMHTVHFSLAVAGGTTLTYRLHGQAIMHDEAAAHISHFPDIEELTQMRTPSFHCHRAKTR
jgi:hypothetical protein